MFATLYVSISVRSNSLSSPPNEFSTLYTSNVNKFLLKIKEILKYITMNLLPLNTDIETKYFINESDDHPIQYNQI